MHHSKLSGTLHVAPGSLFSALLNAAILDHVRFHMIQDGGTQDDSTQENQKEETTMKEGHCDHSEFQKTAILDD